MAFFFFFFFYSAETSSLLTTLKLQPSALRSRISVALARLTQFTFQLMPVAIVLPKQRVFNGNGTRAAQGKFISTRSGVVASGFHYLYPW
jgi:hypothetical protein